MRDFWHSWLIKDDPASSTLGRSSGISIKAWCRQQRSFMKMPGTSGTLYLWEIWNNHLHLPQVPTVMESMICGDGWGMRAMVVRKEWARPSSTSLSRIRSLRSIMQLSDPHAGNASNNGCLLKQVSCQSTSVSVSAKSKTYLILYYLKKGGSKFIHVRFHDHHF